MYTNKIFSIINFVNCVCMSFANSSSGKGQFVCVDGGEEDSAEREESGATGTSYDLQKKKYEHLGQEPKCIEVLWMTEGVWETQKDLYEEY